MPNKVHTVFVQNWIERERGWGIRPDGFTIHLNKEHHRAYVDHYIKTNHNLPEAPDEYTTIDGDPIEIEVDSELYNRIQRASETRREDGTMFFGIHGNGKSFSLSPMRPLRDGDINWPTQKKNTVEEKIATWIENLPYDHPHTKQAIADGIRQKKWDK